MAKAKAAAFSMNMKESFQETDEFRPLFNIGCLQDIPSGTFVEGYDGHFYCTGGVGPVEGVGARGNSFKSTLAHFRSLMVYNNYRPSQMHARDTEYSQSYKRWNMLVSPRMTHLFGKDLRTEVGGTFMISSQKESTGNAWFEDIKEYFEGKMAAPKSMTMFQTPFVDVRDGKNMKLYFPTVLEIDSLSMFSTDLSEKILDDAEVGDAKGSAQTVFARSAGVKTMIMMQLPDIAVRGGGAFVFTAHMGDKVNMDGGRGAPSKKLPWMKDMVFKNVPENITFLSWNLLMIYSVRPELVSSSNRVPTYPLDNRDNIEGNNDLQRLSLTYLRSKGGPSGYPFDVILSQKYGVLPTVTELDYLKANGRFGLGGDATNFFLRLYPSVTVNRTTVRAMESTDPLFVRAMTLSADLYQLKLYHPEFDSIWVSPVNLRKGLEDKGYDWNKLLDTRGHWVFVEQEKDEKPFISIVDLLRINAGIETEKMKKWLPKFKADAVPVEA